MHPIDKAFLKRVWLHDLAKLGFGLAILVMAVLAFDRWTVPLP